MSSLSSFSSYRCILLTLGLVIGLVVMPTSEAAELGTAFTVQGELSDGGVLVDGVDCDFEFTLWDAAAGGTQVAGPLTPTITLTDGRFTEVLDFVETDIFTGEARWVRIRVCCPTGCGPPYTLLEPRQELTPTPHALALPGFYTQENATCPNLIGGHTENVVQDGFRCDHQRRRHGRLGPGSRRQLWHRWRREI